MFCKVYTRFAALFLGAEEQEYVTFFMKYLVKPYKTLMHWVGWQQKIY